MIKRNLMITTLILLMLIGCAQKAVLQKTGSVLLTQDLKQDDTQKYHIEQIISRTVTVSGRTQTQQIIMEMELENRVDRIVDDSIFIDVTLMEISGSINAGGSFSQIPDIDEMKGIMIGVVLLADGSAEIVEEPDKAKELKFQIDSYTETLYGFMPNKKVKSGESWTIERSDDESSSKSIYTLQGIQPGKGNSQTYTITGKSEFSVDSQTQRQGMEIQSNLSGTSSRTSQCSLNDGFIVSHKTHSAMEGNTTILGSPQGDMEMPTFMNLDVKIKRIQ